MDGKRGEFWRFDTRDINSLLIVVSETKWGELGEGIANSLNGITSSIHLSTLGESLGISITGIFQSVIDFSKTYDWKALGTNIYEGINSLFANTDLATVGKGISDFAMGIFDTILVTIQGIDWMKVGSSIIDFILSIDWIGLALKLWDIGNALIDGLLKGILGALSGIGKWIKEHVFDPVVNWFKNLFGIHSPSTVFAELGIFLMQGLFNGISSLVDKVVSVFAKIKDKIVNIWIAIKTKTAEIWSEIKNAIKTPINAIIGFINGMTSGISSGINGLIDALNTLKIDVPSWVTTLTGIEAFGFNIPNISIPQIPMLAKGAVLRGGSPFLAVVNDQKKGQTNVETPLKVIQEALREELTKFSAKVQIATPNTSMLSFNYEPAPIPSLAGACGNYRYDTNAYTGSSLNRRDSGLLGMSEAQVYNLFYNAVESAINNSSLMNKQKDMVEGILKKPTMEIGELHNSLVKDSYYKGANCCGGDMQRFVTANELYG